MSGGNKQSPRTRSWTSVFTFADALAGIETDRLLMNDRYALIETSRIPISTTGSHWISPLTARTANVPRTTALSARGSRNAPEVVAPWRLAIQPSTPSVAQTQNATATAAHDGPQSATIATSNGVAASRPLVI